MEGSPVLDMVDWLIVGSPMVGKSFESCPTVGRPKVNVSWGIVVFR